MLSTADNLFVVKIVAVLNYILRISGIFDLRRNSVIRHALMDRLSLVNIYLFILLMFALYNLIYSFFKNMMHQICYR